MKKLKILASTIVMILLNMQVAYAVEIKNPAEDFFISYTDNSFGGLLTRFIQLILGVVGVVAMAYIIIGGFQYMTSRGDEEQASAGKKTVVNAIIGLVIVIFSYVIIAVVINALKPNGKV